VGSGNSLEIRWLQAGFGQGSLTNFSWPLGFSV
jgi:hypothetical protein